MMAVVHTKHPTELKAAAADLGWASGGQPAGATGDATRSCRSLAGVIAGTTSPNWHVCQVLTQASNRRRVE